MNATRQVLPDRHLHGRQPPLAPEQRSVQASPSAATRINSGHRACQGCGEALGARYAVDAAMRAAAAADRANATGCLEVFRRRILRRPGRCRGSTRCSATPPRWPPASWRRAEGEGPAKRRARDRAGRRRRHHRHRLRLPVGHVRAQRRRPLHLLRQRGLHEHRRAALGHAAGARTATTPAVGASRATFGQGKFVPRSRWRTDPLRRDRHGRRPARPRGQGRKAMAMHGARYPRPGAVSAGLGSGLPRHHPLARLASARSRACSRYSRPSRASRRGQDPQRRVPVEEYLKPQKRGCAPVRAARGGHRRSRVASRRRPTQHPRVRPASMRWRWRHDDMASPSPSRSTSARRSPTRPAPGARRARSTSTACRPAMQRLPGRRGHPGLALPRRERRLRERLAPPDARQPASRPSWAGSATTTSCEGACNRGQLDEAVGINSVERFLGDEALRRRLGLRRRAESSGKRVLVVGAGPSGLSAAYHLRRLGHASRSREAGPQAGGMMRFGIPEVPPAARGARRRGAAHRRPRRRSEAEQQGHRHPDATMQAGRFDAAFLAVGAHIARRASSPASDGAHPRRGLGAAQHGGEGQAMLGRRVVVYGGGNTAIDVRAHRQAARRHRGVIVYRRTRERMPAHDFEVEEALQEGVMMKWLSTIKQGRRRRAITVENDGARQAARSRPASSRRWRPISLARARPGRRPVAARGRGRLVIEGRRGAGRPANMMTGHPGIFAGGDMVPAERNVTVAVGHGKKAARNIDAWLRGRRRDAAPSTRSPRSRLAEPWYYGDAPAENRCARARHLAPSPSTRCRSGLTRATPVRGAPLPVLRQLLRVRQLLRRVPRQRRDQARPGQRFGSTTTTARAAAAHNSDNAASSCCTGTPPCRKPSTSEARSLFVTTVARCSSSLSLLAVARRWCRTRRWPRCLPGWQPRRGAAAADRPVDRPPALGGGCGAGALAGYAGLGHRPAAAPGLGAPRLHRPAGAGHRLPPAGAVVPARGGCSRWSRHAQAPRRCRRRRSAYSAASSPRRARWAWRLTLKRPAAAGLDHPPADVGSGPAGVRLIRPTSLSR